MKPSDLKQLIETYRKESGFTDYDVEQIAQRYAGVAIAERDKEIVKMITKYDLIPVQVREENPHYWNGYKKTIEIIINLLNKE